MNVKTFLCLMVAIALGWLIAVWGGAAWLTPDLKNLSPQEASSTLDEAYDPE